MTTALLSHAARAAFPTPSTVDFQVPAGACDCHVHVFEPKLFPFAAKRVYTPDTATIDDLRAHLRLLHMDRVVLINPSPYGLDNSCMLAALKALGPEQARGIAVVGPEPEAGALKALHAGGVRGLRLNLATFGSEDSARAAASLKAMAAAVADLGWNLQIYTNLGTIKSLAETIAALPAPVVIDHFGSLKAAQGLHQPGFPELVDLLKTGHIYIKISAPYRISTAAGYADVKPFVETLASARPDRLLWASDWPHTMPAPGTKRSPDKIEHFWPEDDGRDLNLTASWIGKSETLRQILVANPQRLFWS